MDNLPAGVTEGHPHFNDDVSTPEYEYRNKLTTREQQQVCLEWLEAIDGHADFEAWRDERAVKDLWIEDCQTYCENHDGFWNWVNL